MSRPVRWLRLLGFRRGALSRRSDHAQRVLVAAAAVAALLAVPVAADAAGAVAPETATDRYQTVATFAEDAERAMSYSEYGTVPSVTARATWQAPGGAARSGEVEIGWSVKKGDKTVIWTDPVGNVVDGPQSSVRHVVAVLLAGTAAVVGWLAGVVVCYLLIGWLLFRRRVAAWDAEWERADREWRQTA